MNVLELKACKEDIPTFRKQVNDHEDAVLALETSVRSLIKLSKASVELAEGTFHFHLHLHRPGWDESQGGSFFFLS